MKKPKVFYGYWVMAACFLYVAIGAGSSFLSFSFFVTPLESDMGWSRTEIMAAFTIFTLCMGITGPFVGRLVDRYGARKTIFLGALVVAMGFVLISQTNGLVQFYFGYAIVGMASSAIGPVTSTSIVSNWFTRRRGLAIGIMSMGVGIGGFVFAPLIAVYLIPHLGWSHTYLALALIVGVVITLLALFLIRTRPADMGLFPDGMEADETASIAGAEASAAEGLSLKMALATPAFWLITASVIFTHAHVGISQNVAPHLSDIGFPVVIAASAISTTSIVSTASMFLFGWLCDKIPAKFSFAIGLGLMALGTLVFINVQAGSPVWMVWLYAVVFGVGMGSWMPSMSMLTSSNFGLASYGTIFGMMNLFQSFGNASGPLFAGYLYDTMGTYRWAFIIILAMLVLAIPLILAARRPAGQFRHSQPAH